MRMRERVADLLRRWRIARYERRQMMQAIKDERARDHVERAREGIKDVHPGGAGG